MYAFCISLPFASYLAVLAPIVAWSARSWTALGLILLAASAIFAAAIGSLRLFKRGVDSPGSTLLSFAVSLGLVASVQLGHVAPQSRAVRLALLVPTAGMLVFYLWSLGFGPAVPPAQTASEAAREKTGLAKAREEAEVLGPKIAGETAKSL